jgi:plasmid stabilization system protein ParE
MTPRFVLEPAAQDDLAVGLAWYEQHGPPNLAAEFLEVVSDAFEAIERAPLQFHFERADIRKAVLRRFPYIVYFVVLPDVISGIAVFHSSRDPAIWHRRADV